MKRWNFGGSACVRTVCVGLASLHWFYGWPSGPPARPSRTRRCPVTWVSTASPRSISKIAQVDVERGLILIEGRGAWRQGRLDHGCAMAVKKAPPKGPAEARQVFRLVGDKRRRG